MTRYFGESPPQNMSGYPWGTFVSNANFTLAYNNPDVEVFHLTPIPACFLKQLAPTTIVRICPST